MFSRPIRSESQPHTGRVMPFRMRSIESAKVNAGSVRPRIDTGTSATLKSFAIGASCAVAMRPPDAMSTNMRYMTQNTGVRAISTGDRSGTAARRTFPGDEMRPNPTGGCFRNQPARNTVIPCPIPNTRNAYS